MNGKEERKNFCIFLTEECRLPPRTRNFCPHPFQHKWYITYEQHKKIYLACIDLHSSQVLDFITVPSIFKGDLKIFSISTHSNSSVYIGVIFGTGTILLFKDAHPCGIKYIRKVTISDSGGCTSSKEATLIANSYDSKEAFFFVAKPASPVLYFVPILDFWPGLKRRNGVSSSYIYKLRGEAHLQKDTKDIEANIISICYSSPQALLFVGTEDKQIEVRCCKSLLRNIDKEEATVDKLNESFTMYRIQDLVAPPTLLLTDKRLERLLVFQHRSAFDMEVTAYKFQRENINEKIPQKHNISHSDSETRISHSNVNSNTVDSPMNINPSAHGSNTSFVARTEDASYEAKQLKSALTVKQKNRLVDSGQISLSSSIRVTKGNLLYAWIHPTLSLVCCLFEDLSCKILYGFDCESIYTFDAQHRSSLPLQAALRNNLIDIHKCHQTNNQNTTGDLPILVQVKDEGVRLKENLAYSVSITSASNDNIAPSPYNFAVTSFSLPFDRYILSENLGNNDDGESTGENVVFLEKNILQNGTCRVNVYLHSCLSHKSVLINFVIIEDCRDLHISGIQVDRSRENFIAQIETHAFLQNTKHHIVLYGPLTATNTEADAKLAQRLQEEIMIVRGSKDGTFIYSKAGTFIFLLSVNGVEGDCIFLKNGQKQAYTVSNDAVFERIIFAPRVDTIYSSNFIVSFYDKSEKCHYIGLSSLKRGNTIGISSRIKLSKGETVLDISWQNSNTFAKANEDFIQAFVDKKTKKLDEAASKCFDKRFAAVLTTSSILFIDRNCKLFSKISLGASSALLSDIQSMSWIGFSLIVFEKDSCELKYISMRGTIRPLCSLAESTGHIKICNVMCDRINYAIGGKHSKLLFADGPEDEDKPPAPYTKIFTRPLLPLEPLIIGLIDFSIDTSMYMNEEKKPSISRDISKIICWLIKNFTLVSNESFGGIDESSDGPSDDAGISTFTIEQLTRLGLEEHAMYLFRPDNILPISATKLQISPIVRSEIAVAFSTMRKGLEELLAAEPELRDYSLKSNAGLSTVGAMPSRNGGLSQYLKSFAKLALSFGQFELAAICFDIAGDDEELFALLVILGKHGINLLTTLLNTLTVTSRNSNLKAAINAYLGIHGFSSEKDLKSSTNRRKRRAQMTNDLSYHGSKLEQFSRRGALLGIGINDLRLPAWETKTRGRSSGDSFLRSSSMQFTLRDGMMKALALDSENSWTGEATPNTAEPVKEQRKFGFDTAPPSPHSIDRATHGKNGKVNEMSSRNSLQQEKKDKESPLAKITGGADPECAIVLYIRFEENGEFDDVIEKPQRDSGPYATKTAIFGSKSHCSWPDEDSPVDDVSRKQHQHVLQFRSSETDAKSLPSGAGGVLWGLRVMMLNNITMHLGFHQNLQHRNHRFATYELWARKTVNYDLLLMGLGAGLSKDYKTQDVDVEWQWSLTMNDTGLSFKSSSGSVIEGHAVNSDSKPRNISNKWVHVALSIDALRSPPFVSLYIDGVLIADGAVDEPRGDHLFYANPSAAIYFGPNFVGKITEIRVWALVRPQDQIYANREWPLKMAKKKRKNRLQGIKISASGQPKTKAPGVLKPMVKLSGLSASKSRGRRARKKTISSKGN